MARVPSRAAALRWSGETNASAGSRARCMKPRVIYWNNIPAPYMVERFNAVAERGNVDLEVWFSTRTESDRSWQVEEEAWRFLYRYLPAIPGRPTSTIPLPALRTRPDALVSLYATP